MAWMAAAAPYMQLAGTALSTYGAYQGSKASKDAYSQQSEVSARNAQVSEWQAQDALARGSRDASRSRMRTRQVKGAQRAAMAANGVDLGTGSALNILTDTDYFGDVDADTIKDNAGKEAWALRTQAQNFSDEASLLRSRSDREKPWLAAGTSFLTAAGKVASNWYGSGGGKTVPKTVPNYPGAEY